MRCPRPSSCGGSPPSWPSAAPGTPPAQGPPAPPSHRPDPQAGRPPTENRRRKSPRRPPETLEENRLPSDPQIATETGGTNPAIPLEEKPSRNGGGTPSPAWGGSGRGGTGEARSKRTSSSARTSMRDSPSIVAAVDRSCRRPVWGTLDRRPCGDRRGGEAKAKARRAGETLEDGRRGLGGRVYKKCWEETRMGALRTRPAVAAETDRWTRKRVERRVGFVPPRLLSPSLWRRENG